MGSIVTWFRRLFHHISCLASSLPSLLFLGYNIAVLTSIPLLLLPPPLSPLPPPLSPSLPPCFNLYDVKLNCIFFFIMQSIYLPYQIIFSFYFILFYFILFYFILFIYFFFFYFLIEVMRGQSTFLIAIIFFTFLFFHSFISFILSFFYLFTYILPPIISTQ